MTTGQETPRQDIRRTHWRWVKQAVIGLAALVAFDWLYPVVWVSFPMPGKVVDAATKKPIANAVVVATWRMTAIESAVKVLAVREVSTDAAGRFEIPGWGPLFRFDLGHVGSHEPSFWIYAPGHSPGFLVNNCCGVKAPLLIASMELPTIELAPAPTRPEEESQQLDQLVSQMIGVYVVSPCAWRHVPKMLASIEQTRRSLEAVGARRGVDVGAAPAQCRDISDP